MARRAGDLFPRFLRECVRPCLKPRGYTLDPFTSEIGPPVVEDLSRRVYGSVANAPWRWPCEESDWPTLAASLVGSVTAGAEWIESLFHLPTLAAYLEGQRRFAADADAEQSQIQRSMASAGIETLYQSPGFSSPRAGTIRPDKVAALSYCYDLMGAWEKALDAWRDYMTTLHDPVDREQPSVRKANERRSYLEERSRNAGQEPDNPVRQ